MAKLYNRLALLFLLVVPYSLFAHTEVDSLLNELDKAIDQSEKYVNKRNKQITQLRNELRRTKDVKAQYRLSFRLYEAYRPLNNDSAIFFLSHCTDMAQKAGNRSKAYLCKAWTAQRCAAVGMYDEAKTFLEEIKPEEMTKADVGMYYYAYSYLYGELAYYTHIDKMRNGYYARQAFFRRKMLEVMPKTDNYRLGALEQELINQKNFKASLEVNDQWMRTTPKGSYIYATIAYYRYMEYANNHLDSLQMMHWLAVSALTDVQNGVYDQGSMWELANRLMIAGDIDRAFRLINYASQCAKMFGSRQRLTLITPILNDIAAQYKEKSQRNFRQLMLAVGFLLLFAVLVLGLYVFGIRQRRKLAVARAGLKVSNDKLTEANRVKDEYLGRFMRMCSLYVDKLDSMRKQVNKLVKNHSYKELYDMTRSTAFREKELDELYENFDTAFLNLFPDFVERFNELLKPEAQIVLQNKKRLNTTLRIFALIRLDIDDSGKIAEFLHYSANTVYNYRAQVKKGCLGDRKDFEAKVKAIV